MVEALPLMDTLLNKARRVLDAFDADSHVLSLTELARRSGVPKTTVHRIASEFVDWGLLERAGTKYCLGMRLFELGHLVPAQRHLRDAALPYLQELHATAQATVHLSIRDGLDVLYVDKLSGHGALELPSRVAGRLPLYMTATGKAILAYSPPELVEQVVDNGLTRATQLTVGSAGRLRGQLERTRAQLFAVEVEEVVLGVGSVAVPLFSRSELIGAVSLTTATSRMNIERMAGHLRLAGDAIGRAVRELERSA
ncbi:IclR family transcriptional regulator [Rhodococcus triatomae]